MSDLATTAVVFAFVVAAVAFVFCAVRDLVDSADVGRSWGADFGDFEGFSDDYGQTREHPSSTTHERS